MRATWWIVSVLAVLAIGGALALRRKPAPAAPPRQTAVVAPETGNEITIQGKIRPQHVIGVSSTVPGFIEAFLVDPGQDVYEGQVLARIGAEGLESTRESAASDVEHAVEQVNRAETALNNVRLELSRAEAEAQRSRSAFDRATQFYSRQQMLYKEGATPRLTYQKALADYEAARKDFDIMDAAVRSGREHVQEAQKNVANAKKLAEDKRALLDEAQGHLAASEVHSPVDGFVVAREGEVGRSAAELGDHFFTIATDLFALEVPLEPKPEVLKRIIPGMPVTVTILDLGGAAFEGKVKEIKDKHAVVEFGSANPSVKPGMLADVRFKLM